jgi:hypothetical protein
VELAVLAIHLLSHQLKVLQEVLVVNQTVLLQVVVELLK